MGGGAGMGAWMYLWIILGLGVVVLVGVVAVRVLAIGRNPEPPTPQLPPAESTAVREAKDTLRMRYARARSTGRHTCRARSNWKTDVARQ